MLKVFLVEDEYVVREGIKKNVDWVGNGYEFVGEASDGELAFPMIQKTKPDIVITDIKMPFMDGLELSRLIRLELPETEIVILTGHQEFEYAKEGIKLGVAEYLTKPISGDDLLKELAKVGQKITEKRRNKDLRDKYLKEIEENQVSEKRNLFKNLVTGSSGTAELIEQGRLLDIDLSAFSYSFVLFGMNSLTKSKDEYSKSMIDAENELKNILKEMNLVYFDRGIEGVAILILSDSDEEADNIINEFRNRIDAALSKYTHLHFFGGIGKKVNRLGELAGSYENAAHAFAHRFFVKENIFLAGDEKNKTVISEQDEFDIRKIDSEKLDRSRIREFLKNGEKSEVVYFIDEFFGKLGDGALKSRIFRQYITMDLYFTACEFCDEFGLDKANIEAIDMSSNSLDNIKNAIDYMVRVTESVVNMRENVATDHYKSIIDEVMDYIEKNYQNEDLSLNMLASHVNFSPNHLSSIFSQETGTTFIKYLTDFRMNRAKDLLRCTNKKSSLISEEVGYKDPHYFSYLFKKTQGMTPTQYRGHDTAEE